MSHLSELFALALRPLLRVESLGDRRPIDEQLLLEADHQGLAPLLAFSLRNQAALPPRIEAELKTRWRQAEGRWLLATNSLHAVLGAFRRSGLSVIPLKGPLLARELYPDPVIRPTSDLDLLIRRDDIERADTLLRKMGYRRAPDAHSWEFDVTYDQATFYVHEELLPVDLHWELLSSPSFRRSSRIDSDEIWARAVEVVFDDTPRLALSHEDLLLYLALHLAVHHAFSGVIWQLDIALALHCYGDKLDWDALLARAVRWRVARPLFFVLEMIKERYRLRLPSERLMELRPRGIRARLMSSLLRRGRLGPLDHLIPLLLVERAMDLAGPLLDGIAPCPEWVRARYGSEGARLWRCYGRHWKRLGEVAGRLRNGLAKRDAIN